MASRITLIMPTLSSPVTLRQYVSRIASFHHVEEALVMVNAPGQDKDENTIHWRFLGKNTGFTGACNAGAHMAGGDLLLFLNDDCTLSEDALATMVRFMGENTNIVATQPVVHRANGANVENIGFWVDTRIGKAHPSTSHTASQDPYAIYGLSGTCMLIRKSIFVELGMFDESFHSYLEDVDLAIRIHKARHTVAPCLTASVVHAHMATSSKMGLYKPMQDVKNWWRLVRKHPDIFPLTLPFLLERGRNISGLVKAWAYKTFTP